MKTSIDNYRLFRLGYPCNGQQDPLLLAAFIYVATNITSAAFIFWATGEPVARGTLATDLRYIISK